MKNALKLKRLLCFAVVDCLEALNFGHTTFDLGASKAHIFKGQLKANHGKDSLRAKILQIFGWHFGRNDDLINSL